MYLSIGNRATELVLGVVGTLESNLEIKKQLRQSMKPDILHRLDLEQSYRVRHR